MAFADPSTRLRELLMSNPKYVSQQEVKELLNAGARVARPHGKGEESAIVWALAKGATCEVNYH